MNTVHCLFMSFIVLQTAVDHASGGKILLYPFAHCSNSHLLNFEKLAELLSEKHQVSMLVSDNYQGALSSADLTRVTLLQFPLPSNLSSICRFGSLDQFLAMSTRQIVGLFYESSYRVCDWMLGRRDFLAGIKATGFDLAIYDAVDPCSRILADFVDVPFIAFNTQGIENILPRHPAYMPSVLSTFTNHMTLTERVLNTISYMVQKLFVSHTLTSFQELKLKHNINTTLHVMATYNRASLRFILGDYGLDYVGPSQPSHVLIGGYMKSPHNQPLHRDVAHFIQHGDFSNVLVVSLGSMVNYYGPKWREIFAAALAKVPYQVIWRYNDKEKPESLGNNTLLLPWLPQAQLLSLSCTKMMVTHCGMNAIYEAAEHGVPIVGIPLYGDQFLQANKATKHAGIGVLEDIVTLTSESLYTAIMQLHTHTMYQEKAKQVSLVLQNRPFTQKELVTRWVDYVITLHGTPHLHSGAYYQLTWYEYFLCDVCLVILLSVVLATSVTLFLSTKLLKFSYQRLLHLGSASASLSKFLDLPAVQALNDSSAELIEEVFK